jgi:hypothetical protein
MVVVGGAQVVWTPNVIAAPSTMKPANANRALRARSRAALPSALRRRVDV